MSSYPTSLRTAANRHQRCAERLLEANEPAEAGYLYGLAAECAVKELSQTLPCLRKNDLLWSHFPDLRKHVLDYADGRVPAGLLRLMADGSGCLGGWHVSIRYSDNRPVQQGRVDEWRKDAIAALQLMDAQ